MGRERSSKQSGFEDDFKMFLEGSWSPSWPQNGSKSEKYRFYWGSDVYFLV